MQGAGKHLADHGLNHRRNQAHLTIQAVLGGKHSHKSVYGCRFIAQICCQPLTAKKDMDNFCRICGVKPEDSLTAGLPGNAS